jgi:carbonic anhydrase/acetyltransferase-like protein (isoleucine patch superfamily)
MAIFKLDGQAPELPADKRYWVAESAAVIGRVRLKTDASVWFGSVLRGDSEWIELGERSQIQDNATLHTDPGFPIVIGDDCVVGHGVVLHGCMLGSNTLIGMGAVVLNGAKIGSRCLVGAGAVVTEGREFPDDSLIVGAPARVVRTLDDEAAAAIARGADIYVRRWRQYAAGLERIG